MFPVTTNSGQGQCMAFPDTCMTPGVSAGAPGPLPYPNIGMCSQGSGTDKVKVEGKEVLRKGDALKMTTGDEAGNSPGSTINSKFKGKAEVKSGWDKVKADGADVGYLTCTVGQNGMSSCSASAGLFAVPSQSKVSVQLMMGMGALMAKISGTGSDPVVDAAKTVVCSSTLQQQLAELDEKGWTIEYGSESGKSGANKSTSTIFIDPDAQGGPDRLTTLLAHEVGHALSPCRIERKKAGVSLQQYVEEYRETSLLDEGYAVLNQSKVQDEVKNGAGASCGQDIGMGGFEHEDYYKEVASGEGTDAEKASEIAETLQHEYTNELTPTGDPITYRTLYHNQAVQYLAEQGLVKIA